MLDLGDPENDNMARFIFERLLIAFIDQNHDGRIDYEEFKKKVIETKMAKTVREGEEKALDFFGIWQGCERDSNQRAICTDEEINDIKNINKTMMGWNH